MRRDIKNNFWKGTALLLATVMTFCMDTGWCYASVLEDDVSISLNETEEVDKSETDTSDNSDSVSMEETEENTEAKENTVENENIDADETVQFSNSDFIDYLVMFYGEKYPALKGLQTDGKIAKSELDKITSLCIDMSDDKSELFSRDKYNSMDISEVKKFTNLEELTVNNDRRDKGMKTVNTLVLPATLKRLVMDNCDFTGNLDVSNCTNLEELRLTYSSFKKTRALIISSRDWTHYKT